MDWAHRSAKRGALPGALFVAESQTRGRGRRGRTWYSVPGKSLLVSIILKPQSQSGEVSLITLAACLALCRALEELGLRPRIKWPNDILIRQAKVAGILAESPDSPGVPVVLGFGLNVHQKTEDLPRMRAPRPTSLFLEGKDHLQRAVLLGRILRHLDRILGAAMDPAVRRGWMRGLCPRSTILGRRLRVLQEGRSLEGKGIGFGPSGELHVRDAKGRIHRIFSGDIETV